MCKWCPDIYGQNYIQLNIKKLVKSFFNFNNYFSSLIPIKIVKRMYNSEKIPLVIENIVIFSINKVNNIK